ncbi:MAG: DUF4142 domain-containing protein [Chthoniobacter sp.]|uniref:DUF4142 domain-containing protein n=1 Tax=Chthoniobacter sp. TaxID=2510640 RepID=UPI0032A5D26A
MKRPLPAALFLSLVLALPGIAADKKSKKPTGTPSTLPPTSPMLVVTPPDAPSTGDKLISSEMSGRDLGFFTKAVEAGREQAFFVDLLKKNASSDQIKKLAEALTTAQGEENMHLAKLAGQKGWSVSLEPTAEDKKAGEELEKLSGSNFDKATMDKVIAASSQAQTAYESAAQSTDPQIKTFAAQMLPLAEEKRHLVEKMTGAGAKTANQLFRHGGASQGVPAETPAATPASKGKAGSSSKATPVTKIVPPAGTPTISATPVAAQSSPAPAGKLVATPTPLPSGLGRPIATPPGTATPVSNLPAIVPSKAKAAPVALPTPISPPVAKPGSG